MANEKPRSHTRRPALLGRREQGLIAAGNDAMVRVCMIAFGLAIAAIAPVPWGWKITLFLVTMVTVAGVLPVIWRIRRRQSAVSSLIKP